MSNSVRPHRRQLTRLRHSWESPGKNTGVGCYFLLQCIKVKSESEVAQLCPTLLDPMDCSRPGSSVHGIFQARVLEWVATAFSRYWYKNRQINQLSRTEYSEIILCVYVRCNHKDVKIHKRERTVSIDLIPRFNQLLCILIPDFHLQLPEPG